MAFQMKDMNKGYYNLTPLASSEMVIWNKERTADRVAGAHRTRSACIIIRPSGDPHTHTHPRARALASPPHRSLHASSALPPPGCSPPHLITLTRLRHTCVPPLSIAAVRTALPAPGTAPLWFHNPGALSLLALSPRGRWSMPAHEHAHDAHIRESLPTHEPYSHTPHTHTPSCHSALALSGSRPLALSYGRMRIHILPLAQGRATRTRRSMLTSGRRTTSSPTASTAARRAGSHRRNSTLPSTRPPARRASEMATE